MHFVPIALHFLKTANILAKKYENTEKNEKLWNLLLYVLQYEIEGTESVRNFLPNMMVPLFLDNYYALANIREHFEKRSNKYLLSIVVGSWTALN